MMILHKIDKRSFTLIELLVVIVIIGILVGILVPVIGKAREAAHTTFCFNDLRQIGLAVSMYADDNNFRLPPMPSSKSGEYWYGALEAYIDDLEVFRCPSYKYHEYEGAVNRFSYGYNQYGLTTPGGGPGVRTGNDIDTISSPAQCLLIADGGYLAGHPELSYQVVYKELLPSTRHLNRANLLFIDNHIEQRPLSAIPTDSSAESVAFWNY